MIWRVWVGDLGCWWFGVGMRSCEMTLILLPTLPPYSITNPHSTKTTLTPPITKIHPNPPSPKTTLTPPSPHQFMDRAVASQASKSDAQARSVLLKRKYLRKLTLLKKHPWLGKEGRGSGVVSNFLGGWF